MDTQAMIVETERLLLRPVRRDDASDIFLMRSDATIMKWSPHRLSTELRHTEEWLDMILGRVKNGGAFNFAVELRPTPSSEDENRTALQDISSTDRPKKVIGLMGAHNTPEIGYGFHSAYWGKGYATEALKGFLQLYWAVIPPEDHKGNGYDYAMAYTDPENTSSIKILEKCGFKLAEKLEKNIELPLLGLRDTLVYRIQRPQKD